MIMKKIILVLLAIALMIAGCVKYEEGPAISVLSVEKKLYGDYLLVTYTVNGIDSLQRMQDRFGLNFHFYYNEDNSANDLRIDGNNATSNYISRYSIINHYKDIRVDYGSIILTGYGNTNNENIEFSILKLAKNDVRLTTTYGENTYYFELN